MRLHDACCSGRIDGYTGGPEPGEPPRGDAVDVSPLEQAMAELRCWRDTLRKNGLASGPTLKGFDALLAVLEQDCDGWIDANKYR